MNKTQFEIVIDYMFVVLFWIFLSIKVAFSLQEGRLNFWWSCGALHFIVNWKDGVETLSNGKERRHSKPVWNKFSKNWHVMIALKSLKIALKGRDRFCRKCVRSAWYPTSRYARQQIGKVRIFYYWVPGLCVLSNSHYTSQPQLTESSKL